MLFLSTVKYEISFRIFLLTPTKGNIFGVRVGVGGMNHSLPTRHDFSSSHAVFIIIVLLFVTLSEAVADWLFELEKKQNETNTLHARTYIKCHMWCAYTMCKT
jgi:hypothetical protein